MRTQKRFTPTLLERFVREGRGTGTYQDYLPWHRVGRGDPSSIGRSHLMIWRKRQLELLSDGEWVGALFSTMLPNLLDVREQLKLSQEAGPHEMAHYNAGYLGCFFPGTLSIAKQLGYKHPRVNEEGRSEYWTMTTDQVLLLTLPDGQCELLAVSFKPHSTTLTKRDKQKLEIDQRYWAVRGVKWLLITADIFEESVGLTLRCISPWALGEAVDLFAIEAAVSVVKQTLGHTFTYALNKLADKLGDKDLAQRAIWQAVWCGALPVDLRRGWRPHLPIDLIDHQSFVALNPVASRRSSWI